MARTVRDARLQSRASRATYPSSAEPLWRFIDTGLSLGYRRNKRGGAWLARRWDAGLKAYKEAAIGRADDTQDADGATCLSFSQAQAAARDWWTREERAAAGLEPLTAGPYSVADALRDYFAARERKGSKGVYSDRSYAATRILPDLDTLPLSKLTTARLRRWHEGLAAEGKLARRSQTGGGRVTKPIDTADAEAIRARRATANRVLTVLKAALNRAFEDGHVASDVAWRRVKPFREVDTAVVRFLSADDCRGLVSAAPADFGALLRGALLTGCRYGELTRMRVADFSGATGTIAIRRSKSGKARHVVLTDEGAGFFGALASAKRSSALLFTRADGKAWGASHQQRPLIVASKLAEIEPAVTFHVLRHTYASTAIMSGISLEVIAEQLGHADTRVTKRHYAHLAPSYVASAIRARMPVLGFEATSLAAHTLVA